MPCPPPGALPNRAIEPRSPTLQADSFQSEPPGKLKKYCDFTLTFHFHALEKETPVFLPGESQGRGSLAGCRLRGRTESDTTDATQQQQPPLCSPGALPDLGIKPRHPALQADSENRTVAFFTRQLFRRQPCYHPLSGLTRKLNVFISPLHFSKKHLYC